MLVGFGHVLLTRFGLVAGGGWMWSPVGLEPLGFIQAA